MAKKVVRAGRTHKIKFQQNAPCGEPYFSSKGALKTAFRWDSVTCGKCLAVHRQELKDKKRKAG
jgi:hypothetical protein